MRKSRKKCMKREVKAHIIMYIFLYAWNVNWTCRSKIGIQQLPLFKFLHQERWRLKILSRWNWKDLNIKYAPFLDLKFYNLCSWCKYGCKMLTHFFFEFCMNIIRDRQMNIIETPQGKEQDMAGWEKKQQEVSWVHWETNSTGEQNKTLGKNVTDYRLTDNNVKMVTSQRL
jgi:hypothetical protein